MTGPVTGEAARGSVWGGAGDGAYQALLAADWRFRGARGGAYGLFQEMEDKDAHLAAVLQTRKAALLACGWRVTPADASPAAAAAARLVDETLRAIPDLHGGLYHLLDALGKGFALAEVMWRVDPHAPAGRQISVGGLKARFQGDFAFDADGGLWMLDAPGMSGPGGAAGVASEHDSQAWREAPPLLPRPGEPSVWARGARPMPARKFVHFANQGHAANPYGTALCARAYWLHWFKKNNLKFWATHNEK